MRTPAGFDFRAYWAGRAAAYRDGDGQDIGAVTAAGGSAFLARMYWRLQERVLKKAIRRVPLKGRFVLDAGCGLGRWLDYLRGTGAEVFGCDFTLPLLEQAKQRHSAARLFAADLKTLPTANNAFDAALALTVLQSLHRNDQPDAMRELARTLKPAGYLLLVDQLSRHATPEDGSHVFPNAPRRWLEMAESAGFRLVEWYGVGFMPAYRGLEAIRERVARRLRLPSDGQSSVAPRFGRGLRDKHPALWAAYTGCRMATMIFSWTIEPLVEKVAPRPSASHALFILQKAFD